MSIIIKGMDMPISCEECRFLELDGAFEDDEWVCVESCMFGDKSNCPLIEIPTPHGRLIDADMVSEKIGIAEKCEDCQFWNGRCNRGTDNYICDIIYDSPTILEAEE